MRGFDDSYTVISCPRCGRQVTLATWKVYSMFRDRGVEPNAQSVKKLKCSRCGAKGAIVTGRR
jgi:ribosomal protein S27AE